MGKVRNGTPSIVPAYNVLEQNMFFSGSPYSIDTDDGSDMVMAINNVVVKQPLFKTDFSGHTKTYSGNVELYGSGCNPGTSDVTNVFTGNHCMGSGSSIHCAACKTPGITCP